MLKLLVLYLYVQRVACWWDGAPGAAPDPLEPTLAALEAAGRPRATVCLPGAACAGAVWSRHWLLARASCVAGHRLAQARVLLHEDTARCSNVTADEKALYVLASFRHPQYMEPEYDAWGPPPPPQPYDATMLLLATPADVPPCSNQSRAITAVPKFASWLLLVPAQFPATWDYPPAPKAPLFELPSTPMRLLLYTSLLPIAGLFLAFVLFMHLTSGTADPIPYDALEAEGESEKPPPVQSTVPV